MQKYLDIDSSRKDKVRIGRHTRGEWPWKGRHGKLNLQKTKLAEMASTGGGVAKHLDVEKYGRRRGRMRMRGIESTDFA